MALGHAKGNVIAFGKLIHGQILQGILMKINLPSVTGHNKTIGLIGRKPFDLTESRADFTRGFRNLTGLPPFALQFLQLQPQRIKSFNEQRRYRIPLPLDNHCIVRNTRDKADFIAALLMGSSLLNGYTQVENESGMVTHQPLFLLLNSILPRFSYVEITAFNL